MSQIDDLPPLREVIDRHGLSALKSLGQNFLLDLNLTARIARAAGNLAGRTVVEIGPGPGGLTRAILAAGAAKVHVIERDRRAIAALEEIGAHYPGRLQIIEGDALKMDSATLGDEPPVIMANLPYNIATPLLTGWLSPAKLATTLDGDGADVPEGSRRSHHGPRPATMPMAVSASFVAGAATPRRCSTSRQKPSYHHPR